MRFAIPEGCDTIDVTKPMNNTTHISIRPIFQADEPFLWDMLYQAIFVPEGFPSPEPSIIKQPDLAQYVENWGLENDIGFLAVETDIRQPVGAAWSRLFTEDEQGYGYVDDETPELSLAVLPEYRGRGVGTHLLTHLLGSAIGKYPAVSLSVHQNNPAFKLYQRLGFEVVTISGSTVTMKKVL
jgi:ribosomal protein S18 acetylase RimI-like enzyme